MSTTVTITPAVLVDGQATVHFDVARADGRVSGVTMVTDAVDRVWAETAIDGRVILSHKLDPNESDNDFDAVMEEVSRIQEFALPVMTNDLDAIAAVAHAYVINGRPEWS